ncbi:hypothetical protein SynBIOSU31_01233 [Synechococcus sp. BIOS-U3-1]|nr:hypothetical protein SynBIOSU31_01233 [Synechococcus sp. BIOS-U3-1]
MLTPMPSLPRHEPLDFKKRPTIEGVSEEGKNEKVISLEKLEEDKESGFQVPNEGRAPSF